MMPGWTMALDGWLLIALWALVLVFVVWLLVREPRRSVRDDALESLRARFARGEIDGEEFERAIRLLDASRLTGPR